MGGDGLRLFTFNFRLLLMDTIVLDIETKYTFGEVGGAENIDKLKISVVGIYSYNKDKYYCYGEDEFDKLKELLSRRTILVGFRSNKFDLPILNLELDLSLFDYPRVDLSDEVEREAGRLVSLDALAQTNLGVGKSGSGILAPKMYWDGEIEKLKSYCLQDVRLTKDLYDLARTKKQLLVPSKHSDELTPIYPDFSSLLFE